MLETGRKLYNGTEVKLGDILKGKNTAKVTVLTDYDSSKYIVEVIGKPEFVYDLDKFINGWQDLEVIGSILTRDYK